MNKIYNINRKKFKLPTLGFTLVELLAVIVILGLILAIAVPRIMDVIDNTRESAYQINEGMMISAARNYLVMNESKNPSESGTMSVITIEELQNSELISSINDAEDSNIDCDGYVVVKNVDDITFNYMPYLKCGNNYETEGMGSNLTSAQILIVGGGGSGGGGRAGRHKGGGGGAGGLVFEPNYNLSKELYNISVGEGGEEVGSESGGSYQAGKPGNDSVFDNIIALGGGAGRRDAASSQPSGDGGSGGGGSYDLSGGNALQSSSSSGGFGNDGASKSSSDAGYGGGGAGTSGNNDGDSPADGRIQLGRWAGGQGLYEVVIGGTTYNFYSMFGDIGAGELVDNNLWFAGGGGGGIASNGHYSYGAGGYGGGGRGAHNMDGSGIVWGVGSSKGEDGKPNTGGGGGGARAGISGAGGSGVVVIRYEGIPKAIGGEIRSFTGYTIHIFTSGEYDFEVLSF